MRRRRSLGFSVGYKGDAWLIISRGPLEIEFFPLRHDPRKSCFSASVRVDDLDALYAAFSRAGITGDCRAIPRLTPPETAHGLRLFALLRQPLDRRSVTRTDGMRLR